MGVGVYLGLPDLLISRKKEISLVGCLIGTQVYSLIN